MSNVTVSQWENNRIAVSDTHIRSIAEAFNVKPEFLRNGKLSKSRA